MIACTKVIALRLWMLAVYSDTTPVRFLLATASATWAVMLFFPGDTFDRPVYQYMKVMGGGGPNAEMYWAVAWLVHSIGMFWRTFASDHRPVLSMAISIFGVGLFVGAGVSILIAFVYPPPAAVAADFTLALAALWVLVRTGVNSEKGWRGD